MCNGFDIFALAWNLGYGMVGAQPGALFLTHELCSDIVLNKYDASIIAIY